MDVLIFGLVNSMALALMAVGFSFVFGMSHISNFAHGGLYVLAGFIGWWLSSVVGLPYPLVAVGTILLTSLFGILIFWLAIYRLKGQAISQVIASFAFGIAILEFFRWRGATGYFYGVPTFVSGSMEIGGVVVDYQRLFICVVGAILVVLLYFFTHHTKIGLACRGMAQNDETALCFGIDSDQVAMISMAIGAGLVAVAALTIIPLGFISIDKGYQVLIFSRRPSPDAVIYTIRPRDTLAKIARRYKVTPELLARINGIRNPNRIRFGDTIKVVKGPFDILVELSRFRLTVLLRGRFVKEYRIGIGKDQTTPVGRFVVRDKLVNPMWYGPDGEVVAEWEKGKRVRFSP